MRYISITFDDGRRDNILYAYPIMKKYGLTGSIFCTTGYIDGSWKKPDDWYSAGEAIKPDEIHILSNAGWEIALHGDCHTTDVQDLKNAIEKFEQWGFTDRPIGFSMPNSNISKEKLDEFIGTHLVKNVKYIRVGRKRNTRTLSSKLLYGLYRYAKIQWAYNCFNKQNVNYVNNIQKSNIYSIVVRFEDNPNMLIDFIKKIPDNTWAVFMLHSILPIDSKLYGCDPWNWEANKFDSLCKQLAKLNESETYKIVNMSDMI